MEALRVAEKGYPAIPRHAGVLAGIFRGQLFAASSLPPLNLSRPSGFRRIIGREIRLRGQGLSRRPGRPGIPVGNAACSPMEFLCGFVRNPEDAFDDCCKMSIGGSWNDQRIQRNY